MRGIVILPLLAFLALGLELFVPPGLGAETCVGAIDLTLPREKFRSTNYQTAHDHALDANFALIIGELRRQGMNHLLEGYDARRVEVFIVPDKPHIPDLAVWGPTTFQNVIPNQPTSRSSLYLSRLDISTEKARERALFTVAQALYRVEMRRSFHASMIHLGKYNTSPDSKGKPIRFMALTQGLEFYRNNRIARIEDLQNDFYRLLAAFKEVNVAELIPLSDPAASMWIKTRRFLGDPGRFISVNMQDFEAYRDLGPKAVASRVAKRHASMLWRAYLVKRLKMWAAGLMVAGVLSVAIVTAWPAGGPHHPPPTPQQIEQLETKVRTGIATPEEIVRLYRDYCGKMRSLESKVIAPDTVGIGELSNKIEKLKTDFPELGKINLNQQ